jgi:hypothetical protein
LINWLRNNSREWHKMIVLATFSGALAGLMAERSIPPLLVLAAYPVLAVLIALTLKNVIAAAIVYVRKRYPA